MRSSRIRSLLLTAVLLAFCGLGWFYLAPTQIGGSTHYVITHGISMEPMLHTGDLVVVRPVSDYKVGQVVAYHSTLLHTVVLHRIVRISGGHYTFKGDNNSFLDPTHPTRSLLIGAMWVHITHGGTVLNWIHKPWVAAALTGGVAMLLLFGGEQQRRRRRRRGRQPATETRTRPKAPARTVSPLANRYLLAASAVLALLFAGLGVYGFTQPKLSTTTTAVPYTQQVNFGYSGHTRPGPTYPSGLVTTGDPLYGQLVHHLKVTAGYRLSSTTAYSLKGNVRLRGTVANTSGWQRSFWLGPAAPISAGRAIATANISLPQLNSLISRVSAQIGISAGTYTLTILPQLNLSGEVGGEPVSTSATQPSLTLNLGETELLAQATSGAPSVTALDHTTTGDVTTTHASVDKLGPVPIKTVRWIGLGGFALFALLALLLGVREGRRAPDPVERINNRYKHLIVPVSSIITDPEHPPIEVRTIEALAQLAERSERLILHDHQDDVDNYLIDDQGTLFRFQALRIGHTNGNGNGHHNGNGRHVAEPVAEPVAVGVGAAETASGTGDAETSVSAAAICADDDLATGIPEEQTGAAPGAGSFTAEETIATATYINGFEPLSDPVESAEAIRLSSKVTPVVQGPQPRRPPVPNYSHWSQRPEVRVGFTLGPLLTLLALRRVRSKRADSRPAEVEEPTFSSPERKPPQNSQGANGARRKPQRGPGDRRSGDRRRNF
jgi:signal peptidase I